MADSRTFWTIGHSNHDVQTFVEMLRHPSIELVADVRRFPGSRRHPQFQRETLKASLAGAGIDYQHFPELGGRRTERLPGSPNTGWRVEAFNAYADYMQTDEFQEALARLIAEAESRRTVILCAEALPWRCHRRLIADALIVRGFNVLDIFAIGQIRPRSLTDFARVTGGQITYPGTPLLEE